MVSDREYFIMALVKTDNINLQIFLLILEVNGEIQLEFEIYQYS